MSLSRMTERLAQHLDRFLSRPTGGSLMARDTESLRCWTQLGTGRVRFDDSLRVANDARGGLLVAALSTGGGPGRVRVTRSVRGSRTATPQARRSERFDSEGLLEALGRVWASEVGIDFEALDPASGARGVPLPTDQCDRRDHWGASPARRHDTASAGASTGAATEKIPVSDLPALGLWLNRRATSIRRQS
jgi:acyl transferase domain-containing protein